MFDFFAGYEVKDDKSLPPATTYDPHSMLTAHHRDMTASFADSMRNSQICLFDASMEKKMIRKYSQAMLSG